MTGTEKQIAWAEKIAAKFEKGLRSEQSRICTTEQEKTNTNLAIDIFMEEHQDARFWIDYETKLRDSYSTDPDTGMTVIETKDVSVFYGWLNADADRIVAEITARGGEF